ncbi:hypothetical protein, partial [Xanthomonas phaseoli]|uniref:hypothetical protein n=1 Tax=Xanthomonas phaseoli TaxID=1985254 RepID=UPI00193A40C0
ALDRIFACLVAGGAGAFLNALKHHVVRKHGTGGLRGVFQGRLNSRIGIYLVLLDPSERYLRWKRIFATPGPTAAIAAELA